MIFRTLNIRWFVAVVLLLCLVPLVEAKNLYRYRNAEGNVVVGYQVPVDAVSGGYEVLNNDGMVIKVVPRALSKEERKAKDAEKKREDAAGAEQERLQKWDESLMLRYSTVADIEAAQKRALGDLQIRLSILKGNRRSLKQEVENYQAQAADTERAGISVNVERLRTIERLQKEIETTDRAIFDRQQEIEELAAEYAADIGRFEMLLEVVELRRTLGAKPR
jgi:chromosome segregation ATPase